MAKQVFSVDRERRVAKSREIKRPNKGQIFLKKIVLTPRFKVRKLENFTQIFTKQALK